MEHSEKQTKAASAGTPNDTDNRAILGFLKRIPPLYAASFLILATVVVGFIGHDLRRAYRDTLAYWNVVLSNSATDQVNFITLWLDERRTDAEVIAENPLAVHLLSHKAGKGQPRDIRGAVERELTRIVSTNGFLGGVVLDTECRIVARAGTQERAAEEFQPVCRWVYRTREFEVIASGFGQGNIWLNLAAPVFAQNEASPSDQASRRVVGAVVLVSDPWKMILPFLVSVSGPERRSWCGSKVTTPSSILYATKYEVRRRCFAGRSARLPSRQVWPAKAR